MFLSKVLGGKLGLSPPLSASAAAAAAAVAAAAAAARPTPEPSRLFSGEEGGSSHGALTISALNSLPFAGSRGE